jgi:predicted acyl esterase
VCAIYASDDRWTDDVHWRGGALRLVDLVDYCHYMTPMTVLPPVPAVWGAGWREEWQRRLATAEPWVLTWLRENRHGDYWRRGSVRLDGEGRGYDRISCAVMLVAGWADGYRNNSFRTVAALRDTGTPHRLLAGPWVHADPTTAYPGPRLDLDAEMAAWFDHWLRGAGDPRDRVDVFVRSSTRPAPFLDQHEGFWVTDTWPSAATTWKRFELDARDPLVVRPYIGVAAWIDCAGHLPWGLSDDQRTDDAHSLVWDWPDPGLVLMGHPRVRLRLSTDAPLASLSVKLCDVFADGTSALVARGSLDLTYRAGVHGPPSPLEPGEELAVELDLDACAYSFSPSQTLRLAVAGADWPNTVAPPAPVTLTVHGGVLELPAYAGSSESPSFAPGAAASSEDPASVSWTTTHDVLRGTTTAAVRHGSSYDIPYGGSASEQYAGEVAVDRTTFAQHASAECTYHLTWPAVDARVYSTMRVDVSAEGYDVAVQVVAHDGEQEVSARVWREHFPR